MALYLSIVGLCPATAMATSLMISINCFLFTQPFFSLSPSSQISRKVPLSRPLCIRNCTMLAPPTCSFFGSVSKPLNHLSICLSSDRDGSHSISSESLLLLLPDDLRRVGVDLSPEEDLCRTPGDTPRPFSPELHRMRLVGLEPPEGLLLMASSPPLSVVVLLIVRVFVASQASINE